MIAEKKVHIVYIITKLELGGAQKVCLALFQQLVQQGFSTTLISGTQGVLVESIITHPQVFLLPQFRREVGIKALRDEWKNFRSLVRHLRMLKKQYPSIMVHTHSTKAGLVGRWAALVAGIDHRLHTIHGYAFHKYQSRCAWWAIYFLELVTSFITTKFVCVSSADYEQGKQLFPRFAKKAAIIRAAVDDVFFIPARSEEKSKVFVFGTVSCFKPQKNLVDLIHAFAVVHQRNKNTRLEIIGDGAQRQELMALIAQYHVENAVVLHGWQTDVKKIMMHWQAFVLTSLWEGLPCAVVEARLLKLPVISYKTGGIGDIIHHQKNGLLYEQKQWQTLAEGMLHISEDTTLYENLATYVDDMTHFSYAAMVEQHSQLYKSLL